MKRILDDYPEMGSYNPCKRTTPLIIAALVGEADVVRILLEAGADIEEPDEGGTPLHYAASRGHSEVSAMLIQAGVDP